MKSNNEPDFRNDFGKWLEANGVELKTDLYPTGRFDATIDLNQLKVSIMSYFSDAKLLRRLRSRLLLCETCYMRAGNRWGGSAMTPWDCAKCGGHHMAGNTAHETLCLGCAIQTGKCQWCNHNDHMLVENG